MNSRQPIEPSLLFLLTISGLLGIYAYFFFVWKPMKEEAVPAQDLIDVIPVGELVLEELPYEIGSEETATGVPKRRFTSSSPLAQSEEGVLTPEPLEDAESNNALLNGSGSTPSSDQVSESNVPLLSFVGIDPEVREMELPPSEDHTVDLVSNIGSVGKSTSNPNAPVIVSNNLEGQSLSSHFYNMPVKGNKILFIVEARSGWSHSEDSKMLALEKELQRVIDSLKDQVLFNVWVYLGDKIACCNKEFMPAIAGNKAWSMIWLKGYFKNGEGFKEENKPNGYPGMYTSKSGLDWASPLFLAVENKPESIFLISSSWKGRSKVSGEESEQEWTNAKDVAWQNALKETQKWIEDENQQRALNGIPPRAILDIKQVVARRHPSVQLPPVLPRLHEDKVYPELKQRILESDIINKCPIFVVLHPDSNQNSRPDLDKFSQLVTPYNGGVYWVK